ncbi:hypothetical protein DYB31_013043, partial [Aphanomyces astaci]
EQVEATASDGTAIPISVVYRKDKKKAEGQPQALHLYGYGSYEASIEPKFRATILPLLDRGVVFAIAHAVAGVPFVDVMNTMSDATIPLTTGEWAEWGNPNELKYFDYMLQYSPYDNVKAQAYPNLFVTGGLFDPRVAKLRDLKTDNNQVLLKMDLDAGHFSASDRYHYNKEKAVELSFLLDQLKYHLKC